MCRWCDRDGHYVPELIDHSALAPDTFVLFQLLPSHRELLHYFVRWLQYSHWMVKPLNRLVCSEARQTAKMITVIDCQVIANLKHNSDHVI